MTTKHLTLIAANAAIFILSIFSTQLLAQEKTYVQIKVFDQDLKPIPNLNLSINENEDIAIDNKGTAFVEFYENKLPPETIEINNPRLEAESWNYSKGVLEIIVREKKRQLHIFALKDADKKPVPNTTVIYKGQREIVRTTNSDGVFELPLPFETPSLKKGDFVISGYNISQVIFTEKEKVIVVKPVEASRKRTVENKTPEILDEKYFKNFDLRYLDSIQSLTVFYAVFKNYQIGQLDEALKQKVDAKFQELMSKLQDSSQVERNIIIGKISDSSFVNDDLKDLLEQAITENSMLDKLREEFEEKILVINEKLKQGGHELDAQEQENLLKDINKLELILEENEKKFYRNQMDYRAILGSFKEQLFDVKDLERRLYVSETQRELEKEYFRKQILIVSLFTTIFGLLAALLYYFSKKLNRQRKALMLANLEIKKMNENLENIVSERTQSLLNVNQEMDTFLYKASHNLRRPICSILGLANVARQSDSGQTTDLFEKVSETAKEMDAILGKLLVVNEINHPENYSLINLQTTVGNMLENYKDILKEKNISLETEIEDVRINSYPHLIQIIMSNLLENAIFYSTLKGDVTPVIHIRAVKKVNTVEFTVFDNGTGIADNIKNHIWNMFFVGDDKSKGNGLGLYIVLKSVEAIKGSITVESIKNEFTRFVVQIPLSGAK